MLYKRKWMGWLMFLPALAFMVAFLIIPFITNIANSFKDVVGGEEVFVGFDVYKDFFAGYTEATNYRGYFWIAMKNTGILILSTIIVEVGFALVLAILLDRVKRGQTFFRVTFFLPIVISATAIGTMFTFLYDPEIVNLAWIFGPTEGFYNMKGEECLNIFDRAKPIKSLLFIVFPVVWQYVGFYFVILLTGIAGISEDLNEAAEIDGAGAFKKVFKITIPMLWNVIRTCMVLAITGALKVYDLPAVLAPNGKPAQEGSSWFLGTYMQEAFDASTVSVYPRAALAVIIVVLGVGLSAISNLLLRENEDI